MVARQPESHQAEERTVSRGLVLGILWAMAVIVCLVGYAFGPPPTKRFFYGALNVLLAFLPIVFGGGGRPPTA
jgi:hypothetical protein